MTAPSLTSRLVCCPVSGDQLSLHSDDSFSEAAPQAEGDGVPAAGAPAGESLAGAGEPPAKRKISTLGRLKQKITGDKEETGASDKEKSTKKKKTKVGLYVHPCVVCVRAFVCVCVCVCVCVYVLVRSYIARVSKMITLQQQQQQVVFFVSLQVPKLAQELSDLVVYCRAVHFGGWAHAREKREYRVFRCREFPLASGEKHPKGC